MNFFKFGIVGLLSAVPLVLLCTYFITPQPENFTMIRKITTVNDLKNLFPKTTLEIISLATKAFAEAQQEINAIVSIPLEQKTFDNTARAYDTAATNFAQASSIIELFVLVHPDDKLRATAQEQSVLLQKKSIDLFSQNKELYSALKDYNEHNAPQENLSKKKKYFIDTTLKDFQSSGLNLPDEQRKKVIALQKELAELVTEFDKNIYADNRTISVTREELAGLDDDFINSLKKDDNGLYTLGIDYPTNNKMMSFCSVAETRKKNYEAFNMRAHPHNSQLLEKIIAKRHQLAELLGFPSYAHLSLESEMVETPERVDQFLNDLIAKVHTKEALEFKELTKSLPESVKLSPEGKLYPWDRLYLTERYKKNNFNIDEDTISHFFPMEHTIQELLNIYQQFLSLEFKEQPIEGLWHPDVKLITVYHNKQLCGYLFLDLHPRDNKYNHACHTTLIPALRSQDTLQPAVSAVIANFPRSTSTQPSLLKRKDVTTFFHEFGHALHALLGATKLGSFSGTRVKTDFVEMPSQMLEEWLSDPAILKQVSYHHQTGEKLSDDVITTLVDLKNLTSGADLQRQIVFAFVSLNYFREGVQKNIHTIFKEIYERMRPHDLFSDDCHFYASFGHLTGYGAKYYSYLWSKVFALDLFDHIKSHGLLDPVIGTQYKNKILAPGGSKDPNELIEDFLGRAPNAHAFMRDLGL
jgi:thimet oligopeptidase